MSWNRTYSYALVGAMLMGVGCTPEEQLFPNDAELNQLRSMHTMTRRPPPDATNRYGDDPQAAELGRRLFDDKSLSSCGTVSCRSCHGGEGLTVPTALSEGCDGQLTGRNPPTILNSGYSTWFMWDGRADRLWSQALLPLLSPIEMHSSPELLRSRMVATYATEYQEIFGTSPETDSDDLLLANFAKAVAAYERGVNRTDAPFDADVIRFLAAVDRGEEESDPAYLGLKTFFRKGKCIACHKGETLSDDTFHNVGVKDTSAGQQGVAAAVDAMLEWTFNAEGPYSDSRNGTASARLAQLRSLLAEKRAELVGAYKTPTLRNVELTAPYMHTGELATLEDVVELYNKGGSEGGEFVGVLSESITPLDLTEEEKAALVSLLKSMTGAKPQ